MKSIPQSDQSWRIPRPTRGFTLIELMAVLAILAVLAMMTVPVLRLEQQRARERELRTALQQIREAIDTYKRLVDEARIPKKDPTASGYPPDLETLATGLPDPRSAKGAKLYLLRRVPRDPFNDRPDVPAAKTWGLRSYASPADAPAPGLDVFDVYSRAPGSGLNGVPYRDW